MIVVSVYLLFDINYHVRIGYRLSEGAAYIAPFTLLPPLINFSFFRFLYHKYSEVGFKTEYRHQFIDFIDSIPAIIGVYGGYYISFLIDSLASLVIVIILFFTAILSIKEASNILLDVGLPPEKLNEIKDYLEKNPRILKCEMIRSRKLDDKTYFIDLIIVMDSSFKLKEVDVMQHEIAKDIKSCFSYIKEVFIHIHAP